MEIIKIASSVLKKHDGSFMHTIVFNVEGKNYESHVKETPDETFVQYSYLMGRNGAKDIEIEKHFGDQGGLIYEFIFDNIQRGYKNR